MIALIVFLFGVGWGSFLNVLVLRLRAGEPLTGRSRCTSCFKQLRWYHNLPLVSFGALKGKCAYCFKPISWQYPLVEFASGLLWLAGYERYAAAALSGNWLPAAAFWLLVSILLVLFVFDVRWYIVPDEVTLPGIALAILLALLLGVPVATVLFTSAFGALFFLGQHFVSGGRWVGDGDIRFGALVGAMVGTLPLFGLTLLMAYVGGALVSVPLLIFKRKGWQSQLPFGAFLAPAGLVTLLWGQQLLGWYLSIVW